MKLLFVNNVSSLLGGTMGCTLSMTKALPDCDITVHSFSGQFSEEARQEFGENVTLRTGLNLNELRGQEFDVVVYQNTSVTRIPNAPLGFSVYYHHSEHKSAMDAAKRADLQLCVSSYLQKRLGLQRANVLHQPVHLPKRPLEPRSKTFTIGRICTPKPAKWDLRSVLEPVLALDEVLRSKIRFEFVGCPPSVRQELEKIPNVEFFEASHAARSRLHHWDALLYLSPVTESFGRVVREAQRCGCCPIVSKRGGFIEQVVQTSVGSLIDHNNNPNDAVVSVVRSLLGTPRKVIHDNCVAAGDEFGSPKVWREKFLTRVSERMACRA